jgi:hypothetical protein
MVRDIARPNVHMADCWYPPYLNQGLAALSPAERAAAEAWINVHVFDAALARPDGKMNVTEALRALPLGSKDWTGSPLEPLWDKTGQDEERAAKLLGNLVCRVGVARPEGWWTYPQKVADHTSRTYVLDTIRTGSTISA